LALSSVKNIKKIAGTCSDQLAPRAPFAIA
jgi:hypothetical protein